MPLLRFFLLFFLLSETIIGTQAQTNSTFEIRGTVTDRLTGEALPGAAVYLAENPALGTTADLSGKYLLRVPGGNQQLEAKVLGYTSHSKTIKISQDLILDFALSPAAVERQEVVITGNKQEEHLKSTDFGQIDLRMKTIQTLPVLMGENDIMKTVQLLPGVKSGGEGNTAFFVRGGGGDQNLVTLDEGTIYNPGHLFNFFSVFNGDAVGGLNLIKGNMPARFGGRLSSVLEVDMREGNSDSLKVSGGIGLISSRILAEGPVEKKNLSFLLAGRRTYADVLAKPFLKNTTQGGLPYYFYDVNGKLAWRPTTKDKITVSGYFGKDVATFTFLEGRFQAKFNWGNSTGIIRWNHAFSDKHFGSISGIVNVYRFHFDSRFDNYTSRLLTGVTDYQLKSDFNLKAGTRHQMQYGINYSYHVLTPRSGEARTDEGLEFSTDRVKNKYAHQAAAYLSDEITISDKLQLQAGIRYSWFVQVGPFNRYYLQQNSSQIDSIVTYDKGRLVKSFFNPEPRASFRYILSLTSSLKGGYSRNAQYLHLVSNAFTSLPLDIWVPSSAMVKPQLADHWALGYFKNLMVKEQTFQLSVEGYYKKLQNQIEYAETYAPGASNYDLEYEFVYGRGTSYGVELLAKKDEGNTQGWIGYTWSKTSRQFPDLNQGKEFPARFDRRHDLSLVVSQRVNERWTAGLTFVYGTGQAYTPPVSRYLIEGSVSYEYGARNSYRMPAYHRLDLSATLYSRRTRKFESNWVFAVYNVYSRQNPFFLFVDQSGSLLEGTLKLQAKKISLIPFALPSVTYNFSF